MTLLWKQQKWMPCTSNGSNACSVISLAVTHWFLTSNGTFPGPGALSSEWINRFHACMILGNSIYDNARQSFPRQYLTATEAAQLFSDYAAVKVGKPYPVRLEDPHPLSPLPEQIRLLTRERKNPVLRYLYVMMRPFPFWFVKAVPSCLSTHTVTPRMVLQLF